MTHIKSCPIVHETDTEKLRERIDRILELVIIDFRFQDAGLAERFRYRDAILQACKEAGLKFVPNESPIEFWVDFFEQLRGGLTVLSLQGEDELSESCNQAINSQIKEIDVS